MEATCRNKKKRERDKCKERLEDIGGRLSAKKEELKASIKVLPLLVLAIAASAMILVHVNAASASDKLDNPAGQLVASYLYYCRDSLALLWAVVTQPVELFWLWKSKRKGEAPSQLFYRLSSSSVGAGFSSNEKRHRWA